MNEVLSGCSVRAQIQLDRLRDEDRLLENRMQEVKAGILELQARNLNLDKENERLRKEVHTAEVTRRVLKWVLAKNIVIAKNADQQMFLRDHVTARPAAIPDIYMRTIFEIVREVELEAEHAG